MKTTRRVRTVGIVGAGTIGASWAAFYALKGKAVHVYDEQPGVGASAVEKARQHLARLAELGLATRRQVQAATTRLAVADTLADAVVGADFVQESVRETYEVKRPLFAELDRLTAPTVPLASSSSGLLMSELQAGLAHPERTFIAHPFNPPHLVPLVELVGGKATSPTTLAWARTWFARLGKTPVTLRREVPGHLANRLAAALWREAIELVASGAATVEDVDRALAAGPGLRWAVMGQHLIYHLGGGAGGYRHFIEHIGTAFEAYWRTMPTWTSIPADARAAIVAGVEAEAAGRSLAELARERDEKLAAVLKALRRQERRGKRT